MHPRPTKSAHATPMNLDPKSGDRFDTSSGALATTAVRGFFQLPTCAGAPTGTPEAVPTGLASVVVDTTNNRLYIHNGTAWKYVALT